MHKTWVVIRREFVERVRTKWFVISTVLGPLIMIAFIVVPMVLARRGAGERSVAVVDLTTTGFGGRLTATLSNDKSLRATLAPTDSARAAATIDSLTQLVGTHALNGFLIVSNATADSGKVEYRGSNVSLFEMQALSSVLDDAVFAERLRREGVDPALVRQAKIKVDLKTAKITGAKTTGESAQGAFVLAYVMWMLTYVGILLYGIQVLGSVVEEKTSRIIEVLVSSLRPFELMAGKIVGVGAVGLFQFFIWGAFAALVLGQGQAMMWRLGVTPGSGGVSLPTISIATIAVFLACFFLGYFLYAAMFAAVGAMTNSESEARQAANVVVMLLVVPVLFMIGVLNDPNGTLAVRLSIIPFSAPIAMPVRWAAGEVPLGQLALSMALLVATLLGTTWVAARIYRVGILMYGKRPTIAELVRWVRTSE
jgi:ABC-2 type transport system permease protein